MHKEFHEEEYQLKAAEICKKAEKAAACNRKLKLFPMPCPAVDVGVCGKKVVQTVKSVFFMSNKDRKTGDCTHRQQRKNIPFYSGKETYHSKNQTVNKCRTIIRLQ